MEMTEPGPAVGPQVIFGFDQNGICTLSVGKGLKAMGYESGELVGQDLFALFADDPLTIAAMRRVLAGDPYSFEREFMGLTVSLDYDLVHDSDGHVIGAYGVLTDVTEQRRIERAERAARHRAALLAELSAQLSQEVLDLDALLDLAVRTTTDAMADVGLLWLRDAEGKQLLPHTAWCAEHQRRPDLSRCTGTDGPTLDVSGSDSVVVAELLDVMPDPTEPEQPDTAIHRVCDHVPVDTALRVPLRSRNHLVGVVDLGRGSHRPFDAEDLDLATDMAARVALAIDNAMLLRSEREAREQLVKFRALADASRSLFAIFDPEGALSYVNPAATRIGVPLTRDGWGTVAAYVGEPTTSEIRESLRTVGHWSGDLVLDLPGRAATVYASVFELAHPDTGAPLGTAWLGQDVTELRATEEALRAANLDYSRFKALVEASPDFVAIAALDGTVMYVNPRGRAMVGMAPDVDVTSTTISDYLTPDGLVASQEVEQPAVVAHGSWEGESTLRDHRGGPPIPVAIASFLMRDTETGEPFALATVQRDISERIRSETALRELADQREALLERLVQAQDDERAQIAADVHDDPVQALAAVDLRLGQLRHRVHERAPDLLDVLEPLQASVTGATERLRALLFDLEPPDLQRGLIGALQRAAQETFEGSGVAWQVDGTDEPDVPTATRTIAYRITREAMINARKHAQPHHVTITVGGRDGGLLVTVEDDGVGLGPQGASAGPGHRGLRTMRDRAAVAGGRCTVRSRPGGGTRVCAWLPPA